MIREVIQDLIQVMDLDRRHIGKLIQFQTETVNVVGTLDRVDHRQEAYLEHGEIWWDLKPVRLTLDSTLTISGWTAVVDPRAVVTVQMGYRELEAPPRPEEPVQLALDIIVGEIVEGTEP